MAKKKTAKPKAEPSRVLVSSRITWPTTRQKIGWATTGEPDTVRFHFEDIVEVTDEKGETTTVTERRSHFVEIPVGGEIAVEGVTFECRDLQERLEHSAWEKEILSRGKHA